MKNEKLGIYIAFIIIIIASFSAGYKLSPENSIIQEKNQRIKELEEVIIQQQITYQYMIRSMPQFKIENWAMNKKEQDKIHKK